jgi:uncharacterized protein with FMN-binding domain
MRRGLTAVIGTVAGTALLVGAKLGDLAGVSAAADLPAAPAGATPGTSSGAPPQPGPSASAKPRPNSSTKAPKPRASSARPPASGGLRTGTFAGPGVSERFGAIKVTIVVSGGRITDVSATCSCSGRSASISSSAFAKLEPRVLTAQSADVQSVSGATYTYEAYKDSLAAAISSAKA